MPRYYSDIRGHQQDALAFDDPIEANAHQKRRAAVNRKISKIASQSILTKCPFCGSPAVVESHIDFEGPEHDYFWIVCLGAEETMDCDYVIQTREFEKLEDAIESWNALAKHYEEHQRFQYIEAKAEIPLLRHVERDEMLRLLQLVRSSITDKRWKHFVRVFNREYEKHFISEEMKSTVSEADLYASLFELTEYPMQRDNNKRKLQERKVVPAIIEPAGDIK